MHFSKESVEAISDLIENRLSTMCIGDQSDLREKITLQRALAELQSAEMPDGVLKSFTNIPRRGRHRKVSELLNEGERTGH